MMLRAAIGFFTRLPVGSAPLPATFKGILAWLPVIGLPVGLCVALCTGLARLVLPALPCGLLGCLVWVLVTGGLHLDGVADCGDGMLVETTKEKRLAIMKDSRLGTFGGTALFLVLGGKMAALAELAGSCTTDWPAFLAFAGSCTMAAVLGRCLVFWAMRLPSARPDGLGEALHRGMARRYELLALVMGGGICLLNGWRGLVSLGVALALTAFLLAAARKRLGGVTGDVFGCLVEVTEAAVLLVCCAFPA